MTAALQLEMERSTGPRAHNRFVAILLGSLCVIAYAPALNNGFIADDFVIMQRTHILESNLWYLLSVVPENFRSTSYVVFEMFRRIVGYDARWMYCFTIFLHIVNCVLFYKLLSLLDGKSRWPLLAAAFFAVFQAPQEAVMWLAAMNEGLQGFFILSTILLWDRYRYTASVVCFSLALVSKESAVIMLLMIPLWQVMRGRRAFPRAYFAFLVPASIFAVVFLYTVSQNFMLTSGNYVVGFQAPLVIVKTLFRLTWPWLYILLAIVAYHGGFRIRSRKVLAFAAWLAIPMLPYMFIHYQHHLPSRQLYMASMVLVSMFALLVERIPSQRLQVVFIAGFVWFNIQYLWLKKDPQFVERATSTAELIQELRKHTPSKVLIIDFPYPQIEIAKAAVLAVPGWDPELVTAATVDDKCSDCVVLRWDDKKVLHVAESQ